MANYRYKTAEIEAMKKDILTHCECETSPDRNGNKSAWRLRLILEGMAMCCRCSKREEARRYRKLALFERLTANDMPNWQTEPTQPATPAEMPQISTKTAETVNVSAEKKNEPETAKYRIFRYRSDNFEKVTIGDKSQCRVICILSTFKGKSYIEIGNTTIGVGTGGQQFIEVSQSITDMSDAELIDIMLNTKVSHNIYEDKIYPYSYFVNGDTRQPPKNAPQSRKASPAVNCHSDTENAGNRTKTAKFNCTKVSYSSTLHNTQCIKYGNG